MKEPQGLNTTGWCYKGGSRVFSTCEVSKQILRIFPMIADTPLKSFPESEKSMPWKRNYLSTLGDFGVQKSVFGGDT